MCGKLWFCSLNSSCFGINSHLRFIITRNEKNMQKEAYAFAYTSFWYAGRDGILRIPLLDDRKLRFQYPSHNFLLKTVHRTVLFTQKPSQGSNPIKYTKRDIYFCIYLFLVRRKGFEPPTFWFVAKHSIQLSYRRIYLFAAAN